MSTTRRPKRPGPAHADRRELRLVRAILRDPALGDAIEMVIQEKGSAAREALARLATRAGIPVDRWRGFRNGRLLIFREQASRDEEALALVVDGHDVRLESAPNVDAAGEIAIANLDEALDLVASPVLAWLRARGAAPQGASRLAALFEPRRRGTAWQSSQS